MHLSNRSCAACHTLIDPIGLGFEKYDNIGRYREKQVIKIQLQRDSVTNQPREPKEFKLELDTTAHIQGIPNSQFSTLKELGNVLAHDPTCERCMVKQIFRYAVGRHETEADQPHLDALYETFSNSGFRFRELALALVTSPPFLSEPGDVAMPARASIGQ